MLAMNFEDKTSADLHDLTNRARAVEAIAKAMRDRWIGFAGDKFYTEDLEINIGIFTAIEILMEPVSSFFYNDCDTIAVEDTPEEHKEPEGPAKE